MVEPYRRRGPGCLVKSAASRRRLASNADSQSDGQADGGCEEGIGVTEMKSIIRLAWSKPLARTNILLSAYLIYMRDVGSKEFNIGVMSDDEVKDLFN